MPRTQQVIIGLGVLLVLIIAGVLFMNSDIVQETSEPSEVTREDMRLQGNELVIAHQYPAFHVIVESVSVDQPSFVSLYENVNGVPGRLLAVSKLLEPGEHENIIIALSNLTRDGDTFLAGIIEDNGNGFFNATKDTEVTLPDGGVATIPVVFTESSSIDADEYIKIHGEGWD